ncbi:MAG: hypothetical protein H0U50_10545 [Pyrinomonadaceae bacterium]|nr:hypothetical protein [Pyrinomonadaceae bacterium]
MKPEITTWESYKKKNGIKKQTSILKLREQGFTKLSNAMKKSTDDTPPKELVATAVDGQDFSLVIYENNSTPFQKGYTITIMAK